MKDENEIDDIYDDDVDDVNEGQVTEEGTLQDPPVDDSVYKTEEDDNEDNGEGNHVAENDQEFYDDGNEDDLEGNASGIELALSKFGVEGGMITFDDGTEVEYNSLNPNQQSAILDDLISEEITKRTEKMESDYGLTEEELAFLQERRKNDTSIEDLISAKATEQAKLLLDTKEQANTDYGTMTDEEVYATYLLDKYPEDTDEQILAKLGEVKGINQFGDIVAPIRDRYIDKQAAELESARKTEEEAAFKELEGQREEIVNSSLSIDSIMGVPVDDDSRNEVLAELLEINEYGDSKFISRVFEDPEALFRLAWMDKYGEGLADNKDDYWKKRVTEAYKKGRNEVAKGLPSRSINFKSTKKKQSKPKGRVKSEEDDLWED